MDADKLEELERLYAAAQFTEKLCVSYDELGPDDNRRLYAFLMEGDPDDGVYVCVDEDPWYGADPPSPRLEAIAAAINALPELVARVRELEGALAHIEHDLSRGRDMLALECIRAALKGPTT